MRLDNANHNRPKKASFGILPASRLATQTFNPIRDILENMELRPNPDKKMISLSVGDPTVFGNLKPDSAVVEAVREALDSGDHNGYVSSVGSAEARKAVAEHVATTSSPLSEDDVVICSGCSCALDLAISAVADTGDDILIPRPGFSLYSTLAVGLGIRVREYDLVPELGWEADLDHMESLIGPRTRAIIVNNPSNPCGSVYAEEHLRAILAVAEKHALPIIADEIYDYFAFPGHTFVPIASLTDVVPVLAAGGLTKRFLVPGWRLGWITIHDRHGALAAVRAGLKRLSQRIIGANTLVQGALPLILRETPASFFKETIDVVHRNAKLAYERLKAIPGLIPVMPQGAMYMMIKVDRDYLPSFRDDREVVEALVREQSVFCLPGACFNIGDYVRIVLTIPEHFMEEACERIEEFCLKHAHETLAERMLLDARAMSFEDEWAEEMIAKEARRKNSSSSSLSGDRTSPPRTLGALVQRTALAASAAAVLGGKKRMRPPPLLRRETVTRLV